LGPLGYRYERGHYGQDVVERQVADAPALASFAPLREFIRLTRRRKARKAAMGRLVLNCGRAAHRRVTDPSLWKITIE
jgi:hypothetical protein